MTATPDHTPPGWTFAEAEVEGVPVWKRDGEPVYVATSDLDQLRCVGAALARFAYMDASEFTDFVERPEFPHRGGGESYDCV